MLCLVKIPYGNISLDLKTLIVKGVLAGPPLNCSLLSYYEGVEYACSTLRSFIQDVRLLEYSLESVTLLPARALSDAVGDLGLNSAGLLDLQACINSGREVRHGELAKIVVERFSAGIPGGRSIQAKSFCLGMIDALMEIYSVHDKNHIISASLYCLLLRSLRNTFQRCSNPVSRIT